MQQGSEGSGAGSVLAPAGAGHSFGHGKPLMGQRGLGPRGRGHRMWAPGPRAMAGTMDSLLVPPKEMRPTALQGTPAQGVQ